MNHPLNEVRCKTKREGREGRGGEVLHRAT